MNDSKTQCLQKSFEIVADAVINLRSMRGSNVSDIYKYVQNTLGDEGMPKTVVKNTLKHAVDIGVLKKTSNGLYKLSNEAQDATREQCFWMAGNKSKKKASSKRSGKSSRCKKSSGKRSRSSRRRSRSSGKRGRSSSKCGKSGKRGRSSSRGKKSGKRRSGKKSGKACKAMVCVCAPKSKKSGKKRCSSKSRSGGHKSHKSSKRHGKSRGSKMGKKCSTEQVNEVTNEVTGQMDNRSGGVPDTHDNELPIVDDNESED